MVVFLTLWSVFFSFSQCFLEEVMEIFTPCFYQVTDPHLGLEGSTCLLGFIAIYFTPNRVSPHPSTHYKLSNSPSVD